MLKTRRREAILLRACLEALQPFVVDNTNPTRAERAAYVEAAKSARFCVVGYFFDVTPREAIGRNKGRPGRGEIPVVGILGTYKRLEPPQKEEGFDELHRARLDRERGFVVDTVTVVG